MAGQRKVTFGERLFSRIDDNAYLQEIYNNILYNYSIRLFKLEGLEDRPVNMEDALTFADILSKSCGTNFSEIHKARAQEMVALLHDMYPGNDEINYYFGSILVNTGNFLGLKRLMPEYESTSLMERMSMHLNREYLSVPTDKESFFFPAQKDIFDSFSKPCFS